MHPRGLISFLFLLSLSSIAVWADTWYLPDLDVEVGDLFDTSGGTLQPISITQFALLMGADPKKAIRRTESSSSNNSSRTARPAQPKLVSLPAPKNSTIRYPLRSTPARFTQAKAGSLRKTARKIRRAGPLLTACIPLVSTNPIANSYHESLISIAGAQERRALGQARPLALNGILCPSDTPEPGCTFSITVESTISVGLTYGITSSDGSQYTHTVGKNENKVVGGSHTSSMTNSVEKSFTNSYSHTKDQSWSDTTSNTLRTGRTNSVNQVKTVTDSSGDSGTVSEDSTDGWSHSNNVHVDVSGGINSGFFPGGSFTASAGYARDWGESGSTTTGSTTSKNRDHSETATTESGSTTSIDREVSTSATHNYGTSDTTTDTYGTTNGHTEGVTDEKNWSISQGTEQNDAWGIDHRDEKNWANTTTTSSTQAATYTFPISPGKCRIPICYSWVQLVTTPFMCVNSNYEYAMNYADMAFLDTNLNNQFSCVLSTISCEDVVHDFFPSAPLSDAINTATPQNSMIVGDVMEANTVGLQSLNGKYRLTLKGTGQLVLTQGTVTQLWHNGMTYLTAATHAPRLRINEKGHLIVEAKDIFSKVKPVYRTGQYTTVWSTQSKTHNYTIGVPKQLWSGGFGYLLVLEDTGFLSLYDAAGVKIWCAGQGTSQSCKFSFGYFHPEDYFVPTDFLSTKSRSSDFDAHTTLPPEISIGPNREVKSLDYNCSDGLWGGTGIQSPNGRFTWSLEPSGNMVVRDNGRIMWATYSSFVNGTVPPYRAILTNQGEFGIRDSRLKWVYKSTVFSNRDKPPYTAKILDEGRLVVTSKDGTEVWESWPQRNMSFGGNVWDPYTACYAPCNECIKPRPLNVTQLVSNGDRSTPLLYPELYIGEKLLSPNGTWSAVLDSFGKFAVSMNGARKGTVNLDCTTACSTEDFGLSLNVTNAGLGVYNASSTRWQVGVSTTQLPLTLRLSESGVLGLYDSNSTALWAWRSRCPADGTWPETAGGSIANQACPMLPPSQAQPATFPPAYAYDASLTLFSSYTCTKPSAPTEITLTCSSTTNTKCITEIKRYSSAVNQNIRLPFDCSRGRIAKITKATVGSTNVVVTFSVISVVAPIPAAPVGGNVNQTATISRVCKDDGTWAAADSSKCIKSCPAHSNGIFKAHPAGKIAWAPCPNGVAAGYQSVLCGSDGKWGAIDFSKCFKPCAAWTTLQSGEDCADVAKRIGFPDSTALNSLNQGFSCSTGALYPVGSPICVWKCLKTDTIASGESCATVSKAAGFSSNSTIDAFNPGVKCGTTPIVVGQTLCTRTCTEWYTVQKGEGCIVVANKFGISDYKTLNTYNPGTDCDSGLLNQQLICVRVA
ncbi:hypothetical protein BJ742DRAFT_816563 [Cladochytrium replicatum]|nr:hypothetical protein BJ742DRAFT_816563 [Cladochytrium replicatum]